MKEGATFDWDAVFLPAGPNGYGVETGGGDLRILADIPKEQQDAAWELIKFLGAPENAARWSAASGYIAVNQRAYDTELMKQTVAETPQYEVAKNQLEYGYR